MVFFAAIPPMNRTFSKFLLMVAALVFTIKAGATDRWETLRAINWVENPTNQTRIGRFGELGPYQFRQATWRMHTDKPFRMATERQAADEVAVKHYEWIRRSFEQAGVDPSVFNIAMAWNCGVGAVISGRAPTVSFNYAERVNNLVETFRQRPRTVAEEASLRAQDASDSILEGLRFRVLQDTPRFVIAAS